MRKSGILKKNKFSIDFAINPVLESRDIIRFYPNIITNTTDVLREITSPFVSILFLQNLFAKD